MTLSKTESNEHFKKVGKGQTRAVYCKYCETKMTSHDTNRWASHLQGCSEAPPELKAKLRKKRTASTAFIETASGSLEEVEESSSTGVSTSAGKGTVYNWLDRVTNTVELDELFGKMFYHTGIPFRFADSPSLKAFIAKLRPAYQLPSAKQIAGGILNNVHHKFKTELNSVLTNAQHIHLVSDGWSSLKKDHYVNFLAVFVNAEMNPLLLKTVNTGEEQQDGPNIAKDFEYVIEDIGANKVVSVVTDNAAPMKAAWTILQRKYPGLIINGCAAHTINLLVKDICKLDRFGDHLEHARFITSFVKDRNGLSKRFEKIQENLFQEGDLPVRRGLISVGETRWYTHHGCVKRVLENQKVLRQLVESNVFERIKETAKVKPKKVLFATLIKNEMFWTALQDVEKILKPTSKIVGLLESNDCTLSDIYKIFKTMLDEYESEADIIELVKDRWAFLHTASMGFAYFLDPKTKAGEGFVDNDLYDNAELLKEFAVLKGFCESQLTVQLEYEKFVFDMKNPDPRAADFIQKHSAMTYWLQIGCKKFPVLGKVAQIVFKVPTSQAASERAWSIYDFILTKRRNRLKPEKVTKLVQLYMNAELVEHENHLLEIMMGLEQDDCDSDGELEE
jgi:hypothetical protein